jgi:Tol biopolymer transport system component
MGIHSRGLALFVALAVLPLAVPVADATSVHKKASSEGHFPAKIWSMSADGNVVTFSVDRGYPYDFPPENVIFARDVEAGTTTQVSYVGGAVTGALRRVPGNGINPYNAISADGRYVAFAQWLRMPRYDVVVSDLSTHTQRTVSLGVGGAESNGGSTSPAISADGRYVAFASNASNLVAGDGNDATDVFVRDLVAGGTRLVSLGVGGRQGDDESSGPAISGDGRYVAFASNATNLVPGDTNGRTDVFVRDLLTSTTRLVSRSSAGARANDASYPAVISANGRFVAYQSDATNLVPGDTNDRPDIFVADLRRGTTARVDLASGGQAQSNDWSRTPAISADGRYVEFTSAASNLVAGDTNDASDVFVRDRRYGLTYRVSVGAHGQAEGSDGAVSGDGRYVAFDSAASGLVAGDTNGVTDVFRRDRYVRITLRVSLDTA